MVDQRSGISLARWELAVRAAQRASHSQRSSRHRSRPPRMQRPCSRRRQARVAIWKVALTARMTWLRILYMMGRRMSLSLRAGVGIWRILCMMVRMMRMAIWKILFMMRIKTTTRRRSSEQLQLYFITFTKINQQRQQQSAVATRLRAASGQPPTAGVDQHSAAGRSDRPICSHRTPGDLHSALCLGCPPALPIHYRGPCRGKHSHRSQ